MGGKFRFCTPEDMRKQTHGRRFSVTTGNADRRAEVFGSHGEQLPAGHYEQFIFPRIFQFRVIVSDRLRVDDRLRALRMGSVVPDIDFRPETGQFFRQSIRRKIAPRNGKSRVQKVFGERTHAYPADPDKMHF